MQAKNSSTGMLRVRCAMLEKLSTLIQVLTYSFLNFSVYFDVVEQRTVQCIIFFFQVDISSNENETLHDKLYKAISVRNATKSDAGPYRCIAKTKLNDNPPSYRIMMQFAGIPYFNYADINTLYSSCQ